MPHCGTLSSRHDLVCALTNARAKAHYSDTGEQMATKYVTALRDCSQCEIITTYRPEE
jgi:hypothetical protein